MSVNLRDQPRHVIYRMAAGISWVIETYGILIVHTDRGAICSIGYPAALVWDQIARGRPASRIVATLCAVAGLSTMDAARFFSTCIDGWILDGLITSESRHV